MRYRKKPVVIDAVRWRVDNIDEIIAFVGEHPPLARDRLTINTLEGDIFASPGDWIIKGIAGEFYPCKPDIFDATYEEVDE